jgi:two-component system phosphate regulon sensor histidine kinase PhoR
VHDVLQECWRPLADRARERGLHVEWEVDRALALDTDREKLRLILTNVLDNAVSYADTGGRVEIETASRDGFVQVSVANTGSHLSQEEAEHVFERFWRADEARAATGVHCGLGLSLCRQLMDLLGGSIRVESTPGATFRVVIALAPKAEELPPDEPRPDDAGTDSA